MKNVLIIMLGILLSCAIVGAVVVEQQVSVTVLPGAIDVYSPMQGEVYEKRQVPINLSMSSNAYFKYAVNGDRLRTLCRNCNEYGFDRVKRKPFDDGLNVLRIVAIFSSGEVNHYVNFTVDTKDPKITKVSPRRGFASGEFVIEFQEANPVSIWLNYGNNETGNRSKEAVLGDCYVPKRNRKACNVSVNLDDYDLQEIKTWVNITDIVGNVKTSKPRKIKVDTSKPVVDWFNWTRDGRRVTFKLNITEPNFDEINYIDYNATKPKYRRLCGSLKRRGLDCEKRRSFKTGQHNVSIEILDDAGNREEISEILFVV